MMDYKEFLKHKSHLSGNFGFKPVYIPDYLFDFQKHIAEYAIKKGRCAIFLDTGLGKTAIQLTIAEDIVRKTNKRVLILTPLAVAFQFLIEAEKIGLDDIQHSKKGELNKKIIITNYERLQYYNPSDFVAVLLDESSILKNFDGVTRGEITAFMKKDKYRFLSTATPSPNDFIELGTSSEALGYLGYADMLSKYFTNNEDTIKPQNIGTKWILKGHAKDDFFKWVSSWSISARKPSDLGYENKGFDLPKLTTKHHSVKNEKNLIVNGQIQLFNAIAKNLKEIRSEQSLTVEKRCEKAVRLAEKHDVTVYWCNLNRESDLIETIDKDAKQVKGSMSIDQKEEILLSFINGDIKKLVTKPKMTAFGLNWQHCNHAVFFPTFSYEQYYQSIRRFWRFGQKRDVIIDLVFSDGQKRVLDGLLAKAKKADELFSKLNNTINTEYEIRQNGFDKNIKLPKFL